MLFIFRIYCLFTFYKHKQLFVFSLLLTLGCPSVFPHFIACSRQGSIRHVTGPLARSGSVYIRIQWSYTVYNWSRVKWELPDFPYKFQFLRLGNCPFIRYRRATTLMVGPRGLGQFGDPFRVFLIILVSPELVSGLQKVYLIELDVHSLASVVQSHIH